MRTTVFDSPLWSTVLPFLFIRRGRDGVNGARHRIEVSQSAPPSVFEMTATCAYCPATIAVVRQDARKAWTFNLSCPLRVRPTCARMPATTAMAAWVRAAIAQRDAGGPIEGRLF